MKDELDDIGQILAEIRDRQIWERTLLAGLCMQGLLAAPSQKEWVHPTDRATEAIQLADALLAVLREK